MISKTLRLVCLILLLIFAGGDAFSDDVKPIEKLLIVGTSADYPPFEFMENEVVVGFDIDLANKLATKLGYRLQLRPMKFSSIISSLKTDRIDCAISALNATPERRQNVDFSIDYYSPEYAMVYRKDSPIKSSKDWHNKIIAAQIGSTMEVMLKDELKAEKNFKLLTLEKNTVMIEEVKVHRIDGVLVELAQAKAFVTKYPDILAYSPFGSKGHGYAIAFKKGSLLRKQFNRAILDIKNSGELAKLKQKWGL